MTVIPLCLECKWLRRGAPMKCEAFPSGIPNPILLAEVDHLEPYPGDHGIQFEPKEPTPPISPRGISEK